MTNLTIALSSTEFIFTLIKSGLLNMQGSDCLAKIGAGFCFAVESVIGISLTIILAVDVWRFGIADARLFIRSGAVIIFITEMLAFVTEASLIRAKLKNEGTQNLHNGRIRREILKFLSFATGVSALIFAIIEEGELSYASYVTDHSASIALNRCILGFALTGTFVIFLLSFVFKRHLRLRANVAASFLAVGTLFSIVIVMGGWFEGKFEAGVALPNQGQVNPFEFNMYVGISVFCAAAASGLTAIAAWGMPDMQAHGFIQPANVKFLEITAMGMTGPTMILGMTSQARNSAKQIMLTVLPQVGALTIPLLFPYVWSLFKTNPVIRNEADGEAWA